LSFDVTLPNGQSIRHPDANKFIDEMRERLQQAIEIYEKTPLGRVFEEITLIILYVLL
jgi:hypothetical protein